MNLSVFWSIVGVSTTSFTVALILIVRNFSRIPARNAVIMEPDKYEKLKEEGKGYQDRLSKAEIENARLLGELEKAQADLREMSAAMDSEKKKFEAELAKRESSVSVAAIKKELDDAKESLERMTAKFTEAKQEVELKDREISAFSIKMEALAKAKEPEEPIAGTPQEAGELAEVRSQLQKNSAEFSEVKSQLQNKSAELAEARSQLQKGSAELEEANSQIQGLKLEISKFESERQNVAAAPQTDDEALNKLKADVAAKTSEIERLTAEVKRLTSESDKKGSDSAISLATAKQEMEKEKSVISNMKMELEKTIDQTKSKELEIQRLKTMLDAVNKESGKAQETISAAVEKQDGDEREKEIGALKKELEARTKSLDEKESEILQLRSKIKSPDALSAEIPSSDVNHMKLELKRAQDAAVKLFREKKELRVEMDNLIKAKDAELKTVNDELAQVKVIAMSPKMMENLKDFEPEIAKIEKTINEGKIIANDIKKRLDDNRDKLTMLIERSKENVDLIKQFAVGKEFEDVRKAVEVSAIIQKYEDEISQLKSRVENIAANKPAAEA